jgi:peroxiredoxin
VPFFLILKFAWDQFQTEAAATAPPEESTVIKNAITSMGRSLAELSAQHPLVVVFLRHSGCTFCREALEDLSKVRAEIEQEGSRLALVHMGTAESFAAFTAKCGLGDVPAISDPERQLYRALGLRRGKLGQLLGWTVWWRGFKSLLAGHRPGAMEGDGAQMPGAFLIHQGKVVRRFQHANAAVRPDYIELAQLP